jgi:hypothetical protein
VVVVVIHTQYVDNWIGQPCVQMHSLQGQDGDFEKFVMARMYYADAAPRTHILSLSQTLPNTLRAASGQSRRLAAARRWQVQVPAEQCPQVPCTGWRVDATWVPVPRLGTRYRSTAPGGIPIHPTRQGARTRGCTTQSASSPVHCNQHPDRSHPVLPEAASDPPFLLLTLATHALSLPLNIDARNYPATASPRRDPSSTRDDALPYE